MTVGELSLHFRRSKSTIKRWIADGRIPAKKVMGSGPWQSSLVICEGAGPECTEIGCTCAYPHEYSRERNDCDSLCPKDHVSVKECR